MTQPLLQVRQLGKRFGGLQALSGVDLRIERGQVYGLIGPNGAGKTTFFNVITGLYTPDSGVFELGGQTYEPSAVHKVAQAGIARTFQNIRLFAEMTALENVMVARHCRTSAGVWGAIWRTARFRAEEADTAARAQALLDYVGIGNYAPFKARTLSYGDQRRLEIARALALDPQLLLLDEPAAGLTAPDIKELVQINRKIRDHGITVILIEHHMDFVHDIVDDVVVLEPLKVCVCEARADG